MWSHRYASVHTSTQDPIRQRNANYAESYAQMWERTERTQERDLPPTLSVSHCGTSAYRFRYAQSNHSEDDHQPVNSNGAGTTTQFNISELAVRSLSKWKRAEQFHVAKRFFLRFSLSQVKNSIEQINRLNYRSRFFQIWSIGLLMAINVCYFATGKKRIENNADWRIQREIYINTCRHFAGMVLANFVTVMRKLALATLLFFIISCKYI